MNFLIFFYFKKKWVSRRSEIELLQKACKGLGDWPAPPPLSQEEEEEEEKKKKKKKKKEEDESQEE